MSNFEDLKNKDYAAGYLSDCLGKGTLVLFIGAGTSKGFGLPDWVTLVNSLRTSAGLPPIKNKKPSAEELQAATSEVTDEYKDINQLTDQLQKILYGDYEKLSIMNALDNKLLVAISALLMGSKRGHVTRVVTLNYDSMLEWFLSIFGFVVKTIYQLPELEGSEDVRIYHPHGFVPRADMGMEKSDFIILDSHSANQRLGSRNNPWFELTRHILDTGVSLFVGMSPDTLSDRVLAPLLSTSGPARENISPLGIWIVKGSLNQAKEREYLRNNIVPLVMKEENEISEFLLDICQKASKNLLDK